MRLGCQLILEHKFLTASSWLASEVIGRLFLSVLLLNLPNKRVFIASFERLTWCILKLLSQSLSFYSVYVFAFSV